MNPLPSSSRVSNLQDYNINKILRKKIYVPNLPAPRTPKVKAEENTEVKKDEASPSPAERRKPFREKKILLGTDTFAPVPVTFSSGISIKNRPKIIDSTSNSHSQIVKKEFVDRVESSHEVAQVPAKSYTGKFARISSAPPQDLPVSIPRPRLSLPEDPKKPISLLMDIFDPHGDESPIFLLKTPKHLPRVIDNPINPKASSSKNEVKTETRKCTIHDLPEGQIGTLQIMKSGRLRLVFGECKFWLHRGVRVNFREELAFVNTDAETKTGEIVNLGDIKDRIIAVPESVTVFANENPS